MMRGENGQVIQNHHVELKKEVLLDAGQDGQSSSLRKKRVDSTVEKFKEGFNIARPSNSRMNMTGVTLTAVALGQVAYKDLRTKYHITELRKELLHRGIRQEDLFNHRTNKAMGFNELKKQQLQKITGDTSSFDQLCVEADFTPHLELLDAVDEN